jgi:hypothetical protein
MNKEERATLRRAVERARRLLEEEVADQLEGTFGILQSGMVFDNAPGDPTVRQRLLELITHHQAGGESPRGAVERATREIAFTTLNRFVALKMAERRGLVRECISKGPLSDGIRELADCAPGLRAALPDGGYRLLLEAVMDEISLGLSVLFDRRAPAGLIWPRPKALDELLEVLNATELVTLWEQDETIGWVYQYFNPKEEREAMRKASAAPRNSRELAVRNQFFTPRYVVAFLTDNTLGRIWYEMRKGDTALRELSLLARRPNEVFLEPGEPLPPAKEDEGDLTQEQLLSRPIYIEHRPKKDPRDVKVLDPACGSGHFLLYAFELLERIYEEAWADPESPTSEATGQTLREDYSSIEELRRAAPKLIIEHNLHGIDIDARAVQIAALALWLRAQKAWANLGLKAVDRPRIDRSNIVTAEPMPGEDDLRREFTAGLKPRVLGQLVDVVFEKMKLAGEAGSLLKIEEEIKDAVAEARKQWREGPKPEQQLLFPGVTNPPPTQQEMRFDLEGVTDGKFWGQAEDRILEALKEHAERAENGYAIRRRLFAEDAARGFAFIDLCRQRYDVALMNPPFGDASLPSKPYIEDTYGDTKGDVYKAFVECSHDRLVPAGYLGIISSRTGFFLRQSEDWRIRVVLRLFRPILLADLGSGVLDAMVEVAAYVLRNLSTREAHDLTSSLIPVLENVERDLQDRFSLPRWQVARGNLKRHQAIAELQHLAAAGFIARCPGEIVRYTPIWQTARAITAPPVASFPPLVCIRVLSEEDKGTALSVVLCTAQRGASDHHYQIVAPESFQRVPGAKFAYWLPARVLSAFVSHPPLEGEDRQARIGPSTGDDTRYVRLAFEVSAGLIGRERRWVHLNKGGSASPYHFNYHLVIDWDEKRRTFRGFCGRRGRPIERPNGLEHFFRPGVSWPLRTQSGFNPRFAPRGMIFSHKGPTVFHPDSATLAALVALMNSLPFKTFVNLQVSFGSYEVGAVQSSPVPSLDPVAKERLGGLALRAWSQKRSLDMCEPISLAFVRPALLSEVAPTLAERATAWVARMRASQETVAAIQTEVDEIACRLYGLESAERVALTDAVATESTSDAEVPTDEDEQELREEGSTIADIRELTADLLDYAVGIVLGRFDLRLALDHSLAPAEPDPLAPLPVCSPGMLMGPDGLPGESGRIVSEEWLGARPDANTLPLEGTVKTPTSSDSEYPLRISWNGILVDDLGFNGTQTHRDDIVRRVREVLDLLWKDEAHGIEQEACDILGVSKLHDYFRRPMEFFQDHLKRYSKSRRRAPIYWPLSTASGGYAVWVYYHRLTEDTLYRVVSDYVSPKISQVEDRITQRDAEHKSAQGRDAARLAKELSELTSLLQELKELRDELLRVARLPYRPNLNDGVQITAAPLWRLFRLPRWRSELERTWQALERGDYDWAHLAYAIWPERVRETCRRDRSIAIAHGLEELYQARSAPQHPARHRRRQAG